MLMQAIRDRAQTWVSWVIVGLIVIVMAAFGLNAYFEPESDITVARVNDAEIKFRRFQNAYENERSQVMQQLRGVDASFLESLGLKESVLNKLIDEEVLFQKVLDKGLIVGDAQLARHINQVQFFQKDGQFDQETYEQLLSASRLTPAEWEQGQRRMLMMRQPESVVLTSAFSTNKAIEQLSKFQNEERVFGYAVFPVSNYMKDIEVSEEDAKAYFEENKDDYMHPERVSVEYIELTVDAIAKDVTVDEEAIQQRYEDQKENFSVPERRRASHILIELDPESDEQTTTEAMDKAKGLLERINTGESFEELAKEFSDDPGSATQGGDLGFFGRGIMDQAFEDATYALEMDQVSTITQSAFGLHIIKLTGIEAETVKPLEEVRDSLEIEYRDSVAESRFFDLAEQLDTLAFEHPDTLSVVAEQLGLEVSTSDYFSREMGTGIAQYPKIRTSAFQEEVFENGNNSALIQITNSHVAVIRKKDFQSTQAKSFDEVKQLVIGKVKRDRGAEAAKAAAQEILTKAQAGEEFSPLLEPLEITWNEPTAIKRNAPTVPRQLVQAVYGAKHPREGVIFGEVEVNGGDYAIYQFTEITSSTSDTDSGNADELKERLATNQGRSQFVSLISEWRADADVVTYPDRLE